MTVAPGEREPDAIELVEQNTRTHAASTTTTSDTRQRIQVGTTAASPVSEGGSRHIETGASAVEDHDDVVFASSTSTTTCEGAPYRSYPTIWSPDSVMGTIEQEDANGKFGLVPIPSTDRKDPLNLPNWRRWLVVIVFSIFVAVVQVVQVSVLALKGVYDLEFLSDGGSDNTYLLEFLPPICGSVSALLFIPISRIFGRRLLFIVFPLVTILSMVWASKSIGLWSLLGALCLSSFTTGALVTMAPLVLTDVTFLWERNRAFGLLVLSKNVVSLLLAYASGSILAAYSWREFYLIMIAPQLVAFLLVIVLVPETVFLRKAGDIVGDLDARLYYSDLKEREALSPKPGLNEEEKQKPVQHSVGFGRWLKNWFKIVILPNLVWVCLLLAVLRTFLSEISGNLGPVLLLQPIGLSMSELGNVVDMSRFIGSTIGYFISGIGGDYLSLCLTRRTNASSRSTKRTREAEHQLVNLIPVLVVGFIPFILLGVVSDTPEAVLPVLTIELALGFIGFASNIEFLTLVYAMECYPTSAGTISSIFNSIPTLLATVIGLSNRQGLNQLGFRGLYAIYASIFVVLGLFIIPVWRYGKRMRKRWDRRPGQPDYYILAT